MPYTIYLYSFASKDGAGKNVLVRERRLLHVTFAREIDCAILVTVRMT